MKRKIFVIAIVFSFGSIFMQPTLPVEAQAPPALSKPVLDVIMQMEQIYYQGKIGGICGDVLMYNESQKAQLKVLKKKLESFGPKIIPDLVKVIDSNADFSPQLPPSPQRGFGRGTPPSAYLKYAVTDVLASFGEQSLEYICKSDIPSRNGCMCIESLAERLGAPGAKKIIPLLQSKDEKTRQWARSLLAHVYSTMRATGQSLEGMPSLTVLNESSMALGKTGDTQAHRTKIRLMGETSNGDDDTVTQLIRMLQECEERDIRTSCVNALMLIAPRAPEAAAQRCINAVGDALQKDSNEDVRNIAAWSLSHDRSQYKNFVIQALQRGMNDSSKRVRSHCVTGLRYFTHDDSIQ